MLTGAPKIFAQSTGVAAVLAIGIFLTLSSVAVAQTKANDGGMMMALPSAAQVNATAAVNNAPVVPAMPPDFSGTAAGTSTGTSIGTTAATAPPLPQVLPNSGKGIVLPVPPPPSPAALNASDLTQAAEQAAIQAQAEAETAKIQRETEHNRQSFDRAESGLLPLSDEQIRAFMHRMENTQASALPPHGGPPKGQVRIVNLSLDPGVEPSQINLAANYVTTIDVLDSTGAPWPILDVGIGGNFEVSPTTAGSHVVRIMPLARMGDGNLSILLKDLPTPVIFRLVSGGPNVDLRYEVRVPKFGPNAKIPLVDRPPSVEAGDEDLMSILQNNPPGDAKRLKVSGLDARTMAWAMADHTYVRTPLTLLSPAWSASVSSADGTTVYEVGNAPVLLMSDNGALLRARLTRDDDHDK